LKVHIPTPLYSYTAHRSAVEANGTTVEEVARDLDRQYPGIRFRMIDEQDRIRPHIKIFVNQDQIFELKSRVTSSDSITIIQSFSGG
jgi:sulfur-carrier protein